MIRFDHGTISRPEFWDSPEFQDFLKEWCYYHGITGGSRATQQRSPLNADLDRFRQEALWPLLAGSALRCVYTEEDLGYDAETATVVFHRPLADAMDDSTESSAETWPEHYWWSVCDWRNWLPASRQVQISKRTVFPVAGSRSPVPEGGAMPSSDWSDEHRDHGLLLDPGRDFPAWHLDFRLDGTVAPRRHPSAQARAWAGDRSRGEVTIRLLDLNRPDLVSERQQDLRDWLETSRTSIDLYLTTDPASDPFREEARGSVRQHLVPIVLDNLWQARDPERLRHLVSWFAEELAVCAAFDSGAWHVVPRDLDADVWEPVRDVLRREWPELAEQDMELLLRGVERDVGFSLSLEPGAGDLAEDEVFESATRSAPADPQPPPMDVARVIDRGARVRGFEIENFKAISQLSIDLRDQIVSIPAPYGSGEPALDGVPWTVFLGENGSGKSCCLQAIGLVLAGDRLDDLMAEAGLQWKRLLRRGAESGRILLRFTGDAEYELRFDANGHTWVDGAPRMAGFVRGYGATRLLQGDKVKTSGSNVRLANLLNPRAAVIEPAAWLLGLSDGDFNSTAISVGSFLGAGSVRLNSGDAGTHGDSFLTRDVEAGEIFFGGDPLSYASDGYRAVIAHVCDIMAGLAEGFSDVRNATGIVLIDEIGAHLHPAWRMEITSRFRREFPQIQFFVSTHEPLCLRGLQENEVLRVRKVYPKGAERTRFAGRVAVEILDRSPSRFRVDQLLTSEFFGLGTTLDPVLDRKLQTYYKLLTMTEEERQAPLPWNANRTLEQELRSLRAEISSWNRPVLGSTRRDQLVFEAIDDYLKDEMARENRVEEAPAEGIKAELQRQRQAAERPQDGAVAESASTGPASAQERRAQVIDKIKDIWTPPEYFKDLKRSEP